MRAISLGLALWLATPAFAADPAEGADTEQAADLDALLEQRVVVERKDGSEIPGTLLGVTDQSLTVVKDDGRILTVRRDQVESVRALDTDAAAEPDPVETTPVPVEEPIEQVVKPDVPERRPTAERELVGAAYTGQYFDLFDPDGYANVVDGAFFGGRAYRYFLFVDQDGRRLSQSNAWTLMGDPGAYRRLSGNSVVLPLQVGSTVLGVAGLLVAIGPRSAQWSLPLILGGLALGITSSSIKPIFERRRGKLALERAQRQFGPRPVDSGG